MDILLVRAALRRAEEKGKAASLLKLAAGITATFLTPVVLAFLIVAFESRAADSRYTDWFVMSCVLFALMVTAYVVEWRTRGGYVIQRLREIENGDGGWYEAITHDHTWRYDARGSALSFDLLLYAPRLVFEAQSELRRIRLVRRADRERASLVVQKLLEAGTGMTVTALQQPGETPIAFATVIAYLLVYEVVGVGEKSSRMWLLTEAKEALGVLPEGAR